MDLDELQSVRDRERQTDKLQQLRESFYADAGELIQNFRKERERAAERADDPFDSPEVSRLSDEINTAEQTVEAIYEKRVGKLVKAASFAAADLPAESDGMTVEEQELFETLVDEIQANRAHVLDVLAGETEPEATAGADSNAITDAASPPHSSESVSDDKNPADVEARDSEKERPEPDDDRPERESASPAATESESSGEGVSVADAMGAAESAETTGNEEPAPMETDSDETVTSPADDEREGTVDSDEVARDGGASPTTGPEIERETVRIVDDVGKILGVDEREYDLVADDVVTLPATNSEPLVQRGAAERLE